MHTCLYNAEGKLWKKQREFEAAGSHRNRRIRCGEACVRGLGDQWNCQPPDPRQLCVFLSMFCIYRRRWDMTANKDTKMNITQTNSLDK